MTASRCSCVWELQNGRFRLIEADPECRAPGCERSRRRAAEKDAPPVTPGERTEATIRADLRRHSERLKEHGPETFARYGERLVGDALLDELLDVLGEECLAVSLWEEVPS